MLLRNEGSLLPVDASGVGRVVVLGRLATMRNLGDGGSSDVRSSAVVTPLDGIRAVFGAERVLHDATDASIAGGADLVVVVVGYTKDDEGEFLDDEGTGRLSGLFPPREDPLVGIGAAMEPFVKTGRAPAAESSGHGTGTEGGPPSNAVAMAPGGDRASLRLSADDEALIAAAAAASSHVVVVVVAGSAVVMPWADDVAVVIQSWYSGVEGGSALAAMLVGDEEPAGRLPFAVPYAADHLAFFDRDATAITYDLFHGQWKLDRDRVAARYPFGWGMGFGNTSVERTALSTDGRAVEVTVRNTGRRVTSTVVFAFAGVESSDFERPDRRLIGFARVDLDVGAVVTTTIDLDWAAVDVRVDGAWVTEPAPTSSRSVDTPTTLRRVSTASPAGDRIEPLSSAQCVSQK